MNYVSLKMNVNEKPDVYGFYSGPLSTSHVLLRYHYVSVIERRHLISWKINTVDHLEKPWKSIKVGGAADPSRCSDSTSPGEELWS